MELMVALVGGAFLLANTWMNKKGLKKLKTQNGEEIGTYVEKTYYKLGELDNKISSHIEDKDKHVS